MNTVILLAITFAEFLLIESIVCAYESMPTNDLNENRTIYQPNGLRFQRILRRKKRFLLFPPGSAIVTTMSFTKTLVPRSPSGINMIGECDIFYPLQNKIEDFYPTKKPNPQPSKPPRPPPPSPLDAEVANEEDEDIKQGVLPSNVGLMLPANIPQQSLQPQNDQPSIDQLNNIFSQRPSNPMNNGPFLPTPNGQLPTDQEIGITPGTLLSDPNFNVGSHPGEIYVDNNGKRSQKTPARRYYNEYTKYYTSSWPYQQRHYSTWNTTGNLKTDNDHKRYNDRWYYSFRDKNAGNSVNVQTMQRQNSIYSNQNQNNWRHHNTYEPIYNGYSSMNYHRRGARERRDIFDQLESFMTFKHFDTRSCILRMICEANHYLLPPGKSLFQDIFRVLFTLPAEDDTNDEYTKARQATSEDCDTIYAEKCRFSILGFLISKDRPLL